MVNELLHPKDLEIGKLYYDCQFGYNIAFLVTSKPQNIGFEWIWDAEDLMGNFVGYHYDLSLLNPPQIYQYPKYLTTKDGNKVTKFFVDIGNLAER